MNAVDAALVVAESLAARAGLVLVARAADA